ncbi:hypothetical protein [Enterococcus sp. AZ103]|uniref:hypothetical protein n=1 Tax=Enterococcus sp. AZ103 TaxID=2774628 RepID=UPI003F22AE9D
MFKLMKLEMKKNDFKSYFLASGIILVVTLMFAYFFAAIPLIDPSVREGSPEVTTLSFKLMMVFILNTAAFTCLSTTMLGKIVMAAYQEKNGYLTLSYPIQRKKILVSKIWLVILLNTIWTIVSITVVDIIFLGTQSWLPFSNEPVTVGLLVDQIPLIFTAVFLVTSISLLALAIGWWRNSLPAALFSGLLLVCVPSNLSSLQNIFLIIVVAAIYTLAAVIAYHLMVNKVKRMEV